MDLFGDPGISIEQDMDEADALAEEPGDAVELSARTSDFCIGHLDVEKHILEAYYCGRMPHGLILHGPEGIGKATFAYRLAKFLLNAGLTDSAQDSLFGDPSPPAQTLDILKSSDAFKLVSSSAHPDLFVVERAYDSAKDKLKDSVAVDDIRKVAPFLRKTASFGGWRVVIIDDADTMNRNAQNALLKILEEPPSNAVLMLVTHRLGALIPTIRSRCRTMALQALGRTDFFEALERLNVHPAHSEKDILFDFASGSPGVALRFTRQGGTEAFSRIIAMLGHFPHWPWVELHGFSDQISRGERGEGYAQFSEFLPWLLRKMILLKARGNDSSTGLISQSKVLQGFIAQSSLESLLKICENLESHFELVQKSNLDKRQAVLGAFAILAA